MSPLNKIQLLKIRYLLFGFLFVSLIIIGLIYKWQFIDYEKYLAIANERFKQTKIQSIRGSILATDGTTLVYSEPRFDAYIWLPELETLEKKNIQTREEFIAKISQIIGKEPLEFEKIFVTKQLWIKIAEKLTIEQRDQIINLRSDKNPALALRGVQFQYVNKRIYPENRLASQILGYVTLADREDGYKGVWGLEQYWDGILKPQEGYQATEYDSFGNYIAIGENESIDPKPGSTIQTTINKSIQAVLEQNLKLGVDTFKAKSATGIIINPKTGEIYAMANYPDFDPNFYFNESDLSVFGNLAVSTPYEIGSVGKIFTLASALDLGTVTPETVLLPNGHNGCEIISPDPEPGASCRSIDRSSSGKIIDCICTADKRPVRKAITAADAIISSDNIGFRHIGTTMTYEQFAQYLYNFGVSRPTKIDIAGESVGVMKAGKDWNYADQAIYSYGHGYSITPIEAVMGVGAVANNGDLMQPYLVSKVIDSDGNTTTFKPKVERNILKVSTCDTMMTLMNEVYRNQLIEKRFKYLSQYYIALKSGTALIPYKDRPGYSGEINTTFAGFDASPDRKFVMLIKLEAPQVGDLSWQNVRVVWLNTFEGIKDILKVQPYNPGTY